MFISLWEGVSGANKYLPHVLAIPLDTNREKVKSYIHTTTFGEMFTEACFVTLQNQSSHVTIHHEKKNCGMSVYSSIEILLDIKSEEARAEWMSHKILC